MKTIPPELFQKITERIYLAHRRDYSMVQEYGFFNELAPKLQSQLTQQLFGNFMTNFQVFFDGCNQSFVNRIVVSLNYKSFSHN